MIRCFLVLAAVLATSARAEVKLGTNASLGGRRLFPDDAPWNTEIAHLPVDPSSDRYIASLGKDDPLHPDFGASYRGKPYGIPYVVVAGSTPRVPVLFEYADESDRVLYPIPPDAPIEEGDDKHILVIDRDAWKLYEVFASVRKGGVWTAGSGAVWDLSRYDPRPPGWTSADAAGLPIFAGLVRYDEVVEEKEIRHALRFTAKQTRRAYVYPATHYASRQDDASLPPMGVRLRLKASVDIAKYPPSAQVILKALRRYGMILADNGSDWFVSGAPDARWNDAEIQTLKQIKGADFEVVLTGNVLTP